MSNNVLEKTFRVIDQFTKPFKMMNKALQGTSTQVEKFRESAEKPVEMQASAEQLKEQVGQATEQVLAFQETVQDPVEMQVTAEKVEEQTQKATEQVRAFQDFAQDPVEMYFKTDEAQRQLAKMENQYEGMSDLLRIELDNKQSYLDAYTNKVEVAASRVKKLSKELDFAKEIGNDNKILKFKDQLASADIQLLKSRDTVEKYGLEIGVLTEALRRIEDPISNPNAFGAMSLKQAERNSEKLLVGFKQLEDQAQKVDVSPLNNGLKQSTNLFQKTKGAAAEFGKNTLWFFTEIGKSALSLPGKIFQAIRPQKQLGDEAQRTDQKVQGIGRSAKLLTFAIAIKAAQKLYQTMNKIAAKADEISKTQVRLGFIVDDGQTVEQLNREIMAVANNSRSAFQDTADFVNRIGNNAPEIFGGTNEILAFTNSMNQAMKVSGLAANEQSNLKRQIEAAMAQGTVQGQQLQTILRDAPMVAEAIADYMGLSRQELRAFATDGEITAEVLKNAMLASADVIDERFQQLPMTWEDMWLGVQNVALMAFMPLIESFNSFINSEPGQKLFDAVSVGILMIADIAIWMFDVFVTGITWVVDNFDLLRDAIMLVAAVMIPVAAKMAIAWLAVNWPILAIIATLYVVIKVLNFFGIATQDVLGFVVGLFVAFGTYIWNVFANLANVFIDIAEFFVNVWQNPVYSVQKLFHNLVTRLLEYFANFAEFIQIPAEIFAKAFLWAIESVASGIDWLIKAINKIPGFNIPLIGEFSTDVDFSGAGDKIRGFGDRFDPGEAPEDYRELRRFNTTNPTEAGRNAFDRVSSFSFSDRMHELDSMKNTASDLDSIMKGITGENVPGFGGFGGGDGKGSSKSPRDQQSAADKMGRGKELGDIGEIKESVSISDEDLKYLRDVAERDFVVEYNQVTPNVTLNYQGGSDQKADAKKLLEEMEQMVQDQVATHL